jgi:glutamate synthase domain-containing protein 2
LAAGAAITGTLVTVGENVCGMDDEASYNNGTVAESPDLRRRVELYREWQQGKWGGLVVQENVEDNRGGVLEYAIRELGVKIVELKWGQGAKNIGGEVKIDSLKKAQRLYDRGYIVLPNPTDPEVIEAFERGEIREFERHSRLGMVVEEDFHARVQQLREAGAEHVFLKTGAYRPADLARALKFSAEAGIDVLTIDGAGGGTGMSPWRMMNEWGMPFVETVSLTRQYCERLEAQGQQVPDLLVAGGLAFEDQLFKAMALGAPYVKGVGIARAAMTSVFVAKNIGAAIASGELKAPYKKWGDGFDTIFLLYYELEEMLGERVGDLPPGALGLYHYYRRLGQGLRQLMAGARKFALEHITLDDIGALTREAAAVSGVPYVMDLDREEVDRILG